MDMWRTIVWYTEFYKRKLRSSELGSGVSERSGLVCQIFSKAWVFQWFCGRMRFFMRLFFNDLSQLGIHEIGYLVVKQTFRRGPLCVPEGTSAASMVSPTPPNLPSGRGGVFPIRVYLPFGPIMSGGP